MNKIITFLLLMMIFLVSCNGKEFVYFMEGQLQKNAEFAISNTNILQADLSISLQDSEDMAVYAFQLDDLESHQIVLKVEQDVQMSLQNVKLKIGSTVISIPNTINSHHEIILEDALFLQEISRSILQNEKAAIFLVADVVNGGEVTPIQIDLKIKIKGTFIGGH